MAGIIDKLALISGRQVLTNESLVDHTLARVSVLAEMYIEIDKDSYNVLQTIIEAKENKYFYRHIKLPQELDTSIFDHHKSTAARKLQGALKIDYNRLKGYGLTNFQQTEGHN